MRKEPKSEKKDALDVKDLWIAPRYALKGAMSTRARENRPGGAPNSSRFLELADIALGIKKPVPKRKLGQPLSPRDKQKTEPRSSK
jgi:hypothetical protein